MLYRRLSCVFLFCFFFFFSSRRRHTRCLSDWSSDVCSSDLLDHSIWQYTGTPCNGNSCPGWMMLDDNPSTLAVVPGANTVYQQHTDGSIWQYTGTPCNSNGCGGWRMLD